MVRRNWSDYVRPTRPTQRQAMRVLPSRSHSSYDVSRYTRTFGGGVMPTRTMYSMPSRPSITMRTRPTLTMRTRPTFGGAPSRTLLSGGIVPPTSTPLTPGGGVVPPSIGGLGGQLTGITGDIGAMGGDIVGRARELAPLAVKIGLGLVALKVAMWVLRRRR